MRGIKVERIDTLILMCDLVAMSSKHPTAKAHEVNDNAPESNNEGKDKKSNEAERFL